MIAVCAYSAECPSSNLRYSATALGVSTDCFLVLLNSRQMFLTCCTLTADSCCTVCARMAYRSGKPNRLSSADHSNVMLFLLMQNSLPYSA